MNSSTNLRKPGKFVNAPVMKKDAMALVTGKPVYMDDVAPKDCLVVKVLRSPHAHALIKEIRTDLAEKVDGIVCVLTYKDVPKRRFTMAGQTYPEPSPYDRYILEDRVRFVGDPVAIVAGETEKAVDMALKRIKVTYEVLDAVLDFHTAMDNPVLVHPEDDWKSLCPVGADNKRNLCASGVDGEGDVDAVIADCDIVLDETYHVKAMQQSMMETFRTCTYLDTYGRLIVLSSTQIPFHVRRIVANALDFQGKSACHQTAYRWRFRCKTDGCDGSISGDRNMEDRKTCKNDLHQGGIHDRILTAPRDGSPCTSWRNVGWNDPCHRPAHTFKYRGVW